MREPKIGDIVKYSPGNNGPFIETGIVTDFWQKSNGEYVVLIGKTEDGQPRRNKPFRNERQFEYVEKE